jgi:ornithine carbamoyltransferase
MGFEVRIACPEGYAPAAEVLLDARARIVGREGEDSRNLPAIWSDPLHAVANADVVVTDTWISMGQDHAEEKLAAMMPYQVTAEIMAAAAGDALFLHCLPAHRGEEVTDEVIDGPQSMIWDEAENRLHAQKSVLLWCFGLIG